MKICICGGGSLGHVCAGVLSSHEDVQVSVLTGRPQLWSERVVVRDPEGKEFVAEGLEASSAPEKALSGADMVLLCCPGYLIEDTLLRIRPYLGPETAVGSIVSSTGFFFRAHELMPEGTVLFGFQRVPFISRVVQYGRSANLLGYKSSLAIAVENAADPEGFRAMIGRLFLTPVQLMSDFYQVSLTNSNPILHTGRLYSLWHGWDGTPYDHNILFYKEWDDASSQILIDMDAEFMLLLDRLGVSREAVPPLLEYYESFDAPSLTAKISSIKAFETITAPMKQVPQGWVPDFASRYFTEDFPYGLKIIKELAQTHGVSVPVIDSVLEWGLSAAGL